MERVQEKRVGVESWASKLVVIAIVSVACLFVFESTMVNSGRSEVWKMRESVFRIVLTYCRSHRVCLLRLEGTEYVTQLFICHVHKQKYIWRYLYST